MKKILSILSIIAVLTAVGCGEKKEKNNETNNENPVATETVTETQAPTPMPTPEVDNSEMLKEIEEVEKKDECKVKVIKTDVQKDAINSVSLSGRDALTLTFENKGDEEVTKVNFYVTGTGDDGTWVKVQSNITAVDESPNVQAFVSNEGFVLTAGGTEKISVACDSTLFSDVKAIVYSYTTADGTEHKNEVADEWLKIVTK